MCVFLRKNLGANQQTLILALKKPQKGPIMDTKNYCLILAGGNGSRLWPLSRTTKPKQFLDVLGTGRTLLQQTYDRMAAFIDPKNIYISIHVDYLPFIYEQLPQVDDEHILEEPLTRGTLASVAWGTVSIARVEPEAKVFVTPSDLIIQQEDSFREDVLHSLSFVDRTPSLLVMGVAPTRPETRYGYIQLQDEVVENEDDIYCVKSFTEKPSAEFAEMFVQTGEFLWNAGMLCFHVQAMLHQLSTVPEYQLELPEMKRQAARDDDKLVPAFFHSLPNRNVDVSILERADTVYVHKGHFLWTDMGTWGGIYDDSPKDDKGNVLMGDKVHLYNCENNLVCLPSGQTLVAKGLKDYVIVSQGDILMICPREDVAAMRKMHTDTKFG